MSLFLLAAFVADLGRPLGNSDEAIYGEFAREMQRSHDYLTLRYQGHELYQRPPTAVALYALSGQVVGGELGLRLVPALFTLLVCLGVGVCVWRWTQQPLAGFAAALFASQIPSVFLYGRLAFSDPPFVAAAIGALAATVAAQRDSRWLPWAGACLGAAFAVKSIAAVIPALTLLPWLVVAAREHRSEPGTRRRATLATVWFAALALPYYAYGFAAHGGAFWREHFARVLFDRATGKLESVVGIGGPGAYVEHLWRADGVVVSLASAAAIGAAIVFAIRRSDRVAAVVASYALGTFVLLSAAGTRLPHYLLVFYPAAAMCFGLAVARAGEGLAERYRPALVGVPVVCAALFVRTAAAPPFDQIAVPARNAKTLGEIVRADARAGDTVYSFNWYAPALGYYADRNWGMLTNVPRVAETVGNTGPFRKTRSIVLVPPWPAKPGFYLAGARDAVMGLDGISRVIRAEAGNFVLVWAKPR